MLNLVSGVLLSKIRTPTALVGLFLGPIIIFIPVAGTLSVEPLIRADFPIPETSIFSRLLGVLFFTGIGFSIFFMSTNGVALMISFVLISTWGLVAKKLNLLALIICFLATYVIIHLAGFEAVTAQLTDYTEEMLEPYFADTNIRKIATRIVAYALQFHPIMIMIMIMIIYISLDPLYRKKTYNDLS